MLMQGVKAFNNYDNHKKTIYLLNTEKRNEGYMTEKEIRKLIKYNNAKKIYTILIAVLFFLVPTAIILSFVININFIQPFLVKYILPPLGVIFLLLILYLNYKAYFCPICGNLFGLPG